MKAASAFDPIDLAELDWAEIDQLLTGAVALEDVSRAARWWFVDRQYRRGWSTPEIATRARASERTVLRWRVTEAHGRPPKLDAFLAA